MMLQQFWAGVIIGGLVVAILLISSPGQGLSQQDMVDLLDLLRVCRLELNRGISVISPDSCKSGDLIWPQREDGMCYVKDAIELVEGSSGRSHSNNAPPYLPSCL